MRIGKSNVPDYPTSKVSRSLCRIILRSDLLTDMTFLGKLIRTHIDLDLYILQCSMARRTNVSSNFR